MESKIKLPPEILEKIEKELQTFSRVSMDTTISISVEKKELVRLDEEALVFLDKYARRYVRGRYRLRPRSLQYFLKEKRYKETDVVEFYIPLGDLIKTGILRREERNGYTYWVVGNRILDPKTYTPLYRSYNDTLRTLLRELGYLEIVEEYWDKLETKNLVSSRQVAEIRLDDIEIELYVDELKVFCKYVVGRDSRLYHRGSLSMDKGIGEIQVVVSVDKSVTPDIEKIRRYIRYTELVVEELIGNIKAYVEEELKIPFTTMEISGTIEIENYRIRDIWISATTLIRTGRAEEEVNINFNVKRTKTGYPDLDHYIKSGIRITKKLISLYLYKSLVDNPIRIELPPDYNIYFSGRSKATILEFKVEVEGSPLYPRVLRHYIVVKNMEKILKKELKRFLEKPPEGYKNILGFLRWRDSDDIDTVRFKLAVYKLEDSIHHPLDYVLVAYAFLRGFSQEKIAEALNKPLDVLLEFIRSGKLRLVPYNNGYRILFKGKSLHEIFCYKCYNPSQFEDIVKMILSFSLPRKELEKISRKPIYI